MLFVFQFIIDSKARLADCSTSLALYCEQSEAIFQMLEKNQKNNYQLRLLVISNEANFFN
jgi:hypothetical protein